VRNREKRREKRRRGAERTKAALSPPLASFTLFGAES
jgi:hypothetical protein